METTVTLDAPVENRDKCLEMMNTMAKRMPMGSFAIIPEDDSRKLYMIWCGSAIRGFLKLEDIELWLKRHVTET